MTEAEAEINRDLYEAIRSAVEQVLAGETKVPCTDKGIALVEEAVRSAFLRHVQLHQIRLPINTGITAAAWREGGGLGADDVPDDWELWCRDYRIDARIQRLVGRDMIVNVEPRDPSWRPPTVGP